MTSTIINTKSQYFSLHGGNLMAIVADMVKTAEAVKTEEQYVEFVGEWKLLYKDMTDVTRRARSARQNYKDTITDISERSFAVASAHCARQVMRGYNRKMSELRVEMKGKLKSGAFPKTETAGVDGVALETA